MFVNLPGELFIILGVNVFIKLLFIYLIKLDFVLILICYITRYTCNF